MLSTRAWRRRLALLLAAGACTACGSTVQVGGQQADGAPVVGLPAQGAELGGSGVPGAPVAGDPLGVPIASPGGGGLGIGAGGGSSSSGGSSSGGSTGTGGGTGSSAGAGSGSASGSSGAGGSVSAPGVTAKEIYVGLIYDENAGAVNEAAGVGAITSGDSKANNEAIVDDINSKGGIGGRKVVPVYAPFDSTSSQTMDSQFAAVCEKFTNDQPRVFVVFDGGGNESFRECLRKGGVSLLTVDLPTVGERAFTTYPGYIEQGYPNVDRLAKYTVTALVEQKYFTPWDYRTGTAAPAGEVKVGIYTYDDAVFSFAVDTYLVPALKKLGHTPMVARIAPLSGASDLSSQAAAVSSAQLSFAAAGVTHVIPFESNGGLSTFFMPTSRGQRYFPRYAAASQSGFQALLDAGAAEPAQLRGAVGYGFLPVLDLRREDNPANGPYSNDARRYCLKVMTEHDIVFDSSNAEGIALNSCASFYLLKIALDRTPARITQGTLISTIESLGTSYQRAGTVGQTFRPGRHDPSDKALYWQFNEECGCMRYVGGLHHVP